MTSSGNPSLTALEDSKKLLYRDAREALESSREIRAKGKASSAREKLEVLEVRGNSRFIRES